jgi:hypothetical protein
MGKDQVLCPVESVYSDLLNIKGLDRLGKWFIFTR